MNNFKKFISKTIGIAIVYFIASSISEPSLEWWIAGAISYAIYDTKEISLEE